MVAGNPHANGWMKPVHEHTQPLWELEHMSTSGNSFENTIAKVDFSFILLLLAAPKGF